ncbi:MAG: SIS domain-containing protein [Anaerolineaceae bacterium]|nr:SIS domain-containing protein [Anaerolineaceae bacterium]
MNSNKRVLEKRNHHPYWIYKSTQMIPDLLAQCLENGVQSQVDAVVEQLRYRKIDKIFLLGRGSSYFATLSLKYIFSAITDIPVFCSVTNLFDAYPARNINKETAVFILSTSGKSEGDKKVVEFARNHGAYTIAVTDVKGTLLAQSVDDLILGPGGPKVELPATRTYTSALFRMTQLIINLAKKQGHTSEAEKLEKALVKIPDMLREFMPVYEKKAQENVDFLKDCSAFFVVGYGPNRATVDEGALAFAQCAGVPGVSYEMENFIHGPIQALTKDMGVVGVAPGGPLQDRMLRMMMAVKTIGAKTMVLAPEGSENMPYADIRVMIPNQFPDLLSPIVYMVPLWQTAYQFALLGKGGHPDRLMMDKPEFKKAFTYLMKQDKWVG